MRRSVQNYANVARRLLHSRFFAVVPTLSADDAIALTRSAVSQADLLHPSSPRRSSLAQRRVDAKTILRCAGVTQLRGFHVALEERVEVNDFLDGMKSRLKTTADYHRAMRRLMRGRLYPRILDLFEEMKSSGVTVDIGIHLAVMKAHSRMNNLDMVKQVFDNVVTLGTRPDKFMFNTLVFSHTSTGDVDAAFETFRKMEEDYGIPADSVVCRSLITVCGKGKDVDRAKETFHQTIEKFGAEARSFNTMLEVYAENVDSDTGEAYLQECKDLLASMESKGITPNAFTYVHLLRLYAKLGQSDEALDYLKKTLSTDVECNIATFDFVFRSFMDLELTEKELETHIVRCFDRIKKLKMKPSHITFGNIIDIYEAKGELSKALEFLEGLSRDHMNGAGRCGETFAAQLKIVQRLWESGTWSQEEALTKSSEMVKTMKSFHVSLPYRAYRTWFAMCLKASDVDRALECWSDTTTGIRWPSSLATESMIRLALDHDRVHDAVRVLKDKEITPNEGAYEAILAYCAEKSDTENAETVFEYMKEVKVEPNEAIQEHLGALQLV